MCGIFGFKKVSKCVPVHPTDSALSSTELQSVMLKLSSVQPGSVQLVSVQPGSVQLVSVQPGPAAVLSLLCSSGPGDPGGALNTQPECIMRAGHRAALFTLESILFIERSCSTPRHSTLLTAERRRLHLMLSNAPRCHVAVNRRGQGQL